MKQSVYEIVTNLIIEQLESGQSVPWVKPWQSVRTIGMPNNFKTKRAYNGINLFLLYAHGWESPYFLTFKQVQEMGGKIIKGEKGTPVVFFTWLDKKTGKQVNDNETKGKIPVLKYYTVFNASQIEGIDFGITEKVELKGVFKDIKDAEELLKVMSTRIQKGSLVLPQIKHSQQNTAYYNRSEDFISMPLKEQFGHNVNGYYSTLFHEITHSTGHKDKLNRNTLNDSQYFGDHNYSKEELVAEMGSAFLCGLSGIDNNDVLSQSTAYIKGWSKALKGNSQLIIQASSQAQKAIDYLIGEYK